MNIEKAKPATPCSYRPKLAVWPNGSLLREMLSWERIV